MKKTLIRVLKIVFCIIFAALILPWFLNPAINNIKLYRLSRELSNHSISLKTQIIEKQSICGKLNGNGNGMDFLVTILVKSDLSLEELQKYYSFATVIKQEGMSLNTEYLEHGEIEYSKLKDITSFEDYFVVLIFDGGYPALFDIRGR